MIVRDRTGSLHRSLVHENGRVSVAGARIDNLALEGADLRKADFSDTFLGGGILDDSNCRGANFQRAEFEAVVAMNANFDGCRFDGADFYMVLAAGASFRGASFRWAKLSGSTFTSCDFRLADLSNAAFRQNNLGGGSSLACADLSTAKLDDTVFLDCRYDRKTLFPDGFDPERAGLILDEG